MGGYDVFRSVRGPGGWSAPANLGAPVNSSADDYYYRPIPDGQEAILSSNRAVRDAKTRTSNEDLFLVRPGAPTMNVRLQVIDSAGGRPLAGATLAAFTRADDRERLVTSARTEDGFFDLELPMGTTVELRVQREGYEAVTSRLNVPVREREGFQAPRIKMRRVVVTLADVQELESSRTEPAAGRLPSAPQSTSVSAPQSAAVPTPRAPKPTPIAVSASVPAPATPPPASDRHRAVDYAACGLRVPRPDRGGAHLQPLPRALHPGARHRGAKFRHRSRSRTLPSTHRSLRHAGRGGVGAGARP